MLAMPKLFDDSVSSTWVQILQWRLETGILMHRTMSVAPNIRCHYPHRHLYRETRIYCCWDIVSVYHFHIQYRFLFCLSSFFCNLHIDLFAWSEAYLYLSQNKLCFTLHDDVSPLVWMCADMFTCWLMALENWRSVLFFELHQMDSLSHLPFCFWILIIVSSVTVYCTTGWT